MTGFSASGLLPVVSVNGHLVASDAPALSARDRGFTLADGLFETMRARNGIVFRLERHLARLSDGLRTLAIGEPAELRRWIADSLGQAGPIDLALRVTVTRGPGPGGLAPPADARSTVVIAAGPMPQFSPDTYARGLHAVIASGRRNARSMTAGLKTLSYTDAVAAWLEAQRAGADEAIFLDGDDHCSEATASNLFIVTGGTLVTPPVTCAALPGITRATVLELAASSGLRVEERAFGAPQLATAAEAFLTSSLRGVAPLISLDGQSIGAPGPGPITTRIASAYQALILQECGTA